LSTAIRRGPAGHPCVLPRGAQRRSAHSRMSPPAERSSRTVDEAGRTAARARARLRGL